MSQLGLEKRGARCFAVDGTPVDCVRVGLSVICEERPQWVVSGVNAGANVGIDTYVSGTVAAAREAAALGVSALALSVYFREKLDLAQKFDGAAMGEVWKWIEGASELGEGEFWNVNFPHPEGDGVLPEIVECEVSRRPLPVSFALEGKVLTYTGIFSEREREDGSDVAVCFGGKVSVSRMGV